MGNPSLLLDGTLELHDPGGLRSGADYHFEVLAEGVSFGDPQAVEVVIASLLRDGALVESERDDNIEQSFPIKIKGADSLGVARGFAALRGVTGKRTSLVWTPPDGLGPPTAYYVETSSLSSADGFDDLAHLRNEQVVRLRLVCQPYGHSVAKFVDVASSPPGASDGTVFEDCESTTGWASYGGSLTPSFAVDAVTFAEGAGAIKSRLTEWRPGYNYNQGNGTGGYHSPCGGTSRDEFTDMALDTDTGGYLSVAIRFDPANDLSSLTKIWQSTTAGVWTEVTSWASVRLDANGFVHYRWAVAASQTILGLRFEASHRRNAQSTSVPTPYTWYDDFRILPTASTAQQIVKQIKVEGSARTTGSLHIGSGTDSVALGQVLVVTMPTAAAPAGFNPEGRAWVTQGTLTSDATALDGAYYSPDASTYSTASGKPIFDVPVALLTSGAYSVVALVKAESSALTFGIQAQLRVGSTNIGPTSTAETSPTGLTTGWQFVTVGTVYLPPLPVQSADATTKVRLLFKGAKMANIYVIPAWRVGGQAVADFSIVNCGTGTASSSGPSSHLWIDSPSVEQPQGGWWRGPTPDRLNTQSAWPDAKKPGIHTFAPGELSAFLVSVAALAPTLALEYFPAWHGSAAI